MRDLRLKAINDDDHAGFFFNPRGRAYAQGFEKTVMGWLRCLLTEQGSYLTHPDFGTNFSDLVQGWAGDSKTLKQMVQIAVEEATTQIKQLQSGKETPTNQQLASVELEGIEHPNNRPDALNIYIRLRSVAGQEEQVILPMPTA